MFQQLIKQSDGKPWPDQAEPSVILRFKNQTELLVRLQQEIDKDQKKFLAYEYQAIVFAWMPKIKSISSDLLVQLDVTKFKDNCPICDCLKQVLGIGQQEKPEPELQPTLVPEQLEINEKDSGDPNDE